PFEPFEKPKPNWNFHSVKRRDAGAVRISAAFALLELSGQLKPPSPRSDHSDVERLLSQEEIDKVFGKDSQGDGAKAIKYDFRRPDRIPKDQLRDIHFLHDNFARNLASSLSAYLRAYVMVNLVSVEQLSFAEFSQCLPSPTYLVCLGMKPFDGNTVLELNP